MMFDITYEIVTPESDERGFIGQRLSLRDAVEELFGTRTNEAGEVASIEPSDSRPDCARWITVTNGMEYCTGAVESRSLHFPDSMTAASRARLVRLLS